MQEKKRRALLEWTKYGRVHGYLVSLIREQKLPKTKEKKVQDLFHSFTAHYYEYRSAAALRILLLAILYASLVSAVGSQFPVLSALINTVLRISALAGTTLSLVLLFVVDRAIDRLSGDMDVLSSHIIAQYAAHAKKKAISS